MSAIKGKKHCEKRRNCLLQAISLFLTMFSTAICHSIVHQKAALCGNGLTYKVPFMIKVGFVVI